MKFYYRQRCDQVFYGVLRLSKASLPTTLIGTATLDSLDNDGELTSNGFSFPEIKMVAEGQEVESGLISCEAEPLKNEGITWVLDSELTPGTTIQWYQVFRPATDGSYEFVAIENDVYAQK